LINVLTLLAVVAIGLVVDDAIVVLENIHRRMELGEPPLLAALRFAPDRLRRHRPTSCCRGVLPIAFLEKCRLFAELPSRWPAVIFSSIVMT
jgi:hypothetical protein